MNSTALPFSRSYWVTPGKLLAGCYPGDVDLSVARHKLQGLVTAGVTRVISLMEPHEVDQRGRAFVDYRRELSTLATDAGRRVSFDRYGIRDMGIPLTATMSEVLDTIDEGHARGGCVYVHCWGGKGRTGTVVGCWLMRHGQASAASVLGHLARLTAHNRAAFPEIPQTHAQREFVCSWQYGA